LLVFESNRVVTRVKEAFGVVCFEVSYDAFEREIGKDAVVHQVFHVPFTLRVYRLKQSIGPAIEVRWQDAKLLAQFDVECRRRFHPAASEIKKRIAVMEKEFLPTHGAPKLFRAQVIFHVGEADRGRNAYGPRASRQEVGFGETEASPDQQHVARLVCLPAETDAVGIVANAVSNLVKNPHGALDIVGCCARGLDGKLPDRGVIEVEELGRSKILRRGLEKIL
jgi:hypothetical protein